ncbi:hypothetical protein EGW08_002459 [Elysia chlorotica]|uniref:Uncharacterized protein n=1 Tax=Elysia chlorotica TaxID=188477 RepID=A0A433U7E8_ELYCH|nr:hypothetical protein EGW08_002459 [Elysia chlorotica]
MASNIKKAGSALKKSFRQRRFLSSLELDENVYTDASPRAGSYRKMKDSRSGPSSSSSPVPASQMNEDETTNNRTTVKRGASMTQSMREAVGTIRQKFRMSTRRLTRLQSQTPPGRAGKTRRHTLGGKDVKMLSPFGIETPRRSGSSDPKSCLSMETPTRLRKEVEALTSNMQALSALTPNTLQARARARRDPPLINGSLKTTRSKRRSVTTDIY